LAVEVGYRSGQMEEKEDRIMPNKPFFQKGVGVYVRDLRAFPEKILLIEMSREPGAIWALAGGIVFMIGTLTLIIFKMRREDRD
jgi:cytochrome c biogenesis protein ResB